MNLHALINAIYHEPALILPGAHAAIRQLVESRLGLFGIEARAPGRDEARCGAVVEVPQAFVDENGIAHIPIGGALGQDLGEYERGAGAVDTLDIREELVKFAADEAVKEAILDMDTPGGMALGTPETADAIAAFGKPIYAFTRGGIASAGYWLSAGSDGIYATPSSSIGSIGTVVTYYDLTKMADMQGVKVQVIKSGKYKGMGTPGTALTADQVDLLQQRVDQLTGQFKGYVTTHRGPIADEHMQGQMFLAPDALRIGLIDGIVTDKAQLVAQIVNARPQP